MKPAVIPGWIGWGNHRVGIDLFLGTHGNRFAGDAGPTPGRVIDPRGRGVVGLPCSLNGQQAEGMGALVVVLPDRLIGNRDALLDVAAAVARAIEGEVVET
ncbi:MAG: hypothetical protein AB7G65_19305 [Thermoleophilia bacterium]